MLQQPCFGGAEGGWPLLPLELLLQISGQQLQLPVEVPLGAAEARQQRMPLVQQPALEFRSGILIVVMAGRHRSPGVEAGAELVEHHRCIGAAGPLGQQFPQLWRQAGQAKNMQRLLRTAPVA